MACNNYVAIIDNFIMIVDPRFVNNPELSDVQFLIEGRIFYAHRIILVNASQRFRAMLSSKFCEGSQNCVELSDVRLHIFEVGLILFKENHSPLFLSADLIISI